MLFITEKNGYPIFRQCRKGCCRHGTLTAFNQQGEQILQGKTDIGFPLNNHLLPLAADPARCRDHHIPVGHKITALSKRSTLFFFHLSYIAKNIHFIFFQTVQCFNSQAR